MVRYVFRSARLYYLAADPALAERTAMFYRRNRAAFAAFDPIQPEAFFTVEGQREKLEWDMSQAEEGRCFRFLLVRPSQPGKIVGLAGLNEIVQGAFQSCFISYKVDHALWGLGYGAEAINAVTDWGFRTLGLHRIEANIMPRNLASRRAAEKAGFQEEGLSKQYLKINGRWEDHLHLVRLNEEDMDGRT